MQRLSIGSPSRVHVIPREVAPTAPEAEEMRPEKPIRQSYMKERFVHLIPVLTLLCVLVLYLSSHDLSNADTASFGDASRFIHSNLIPEMGRYEGEAAGAIVNLRALKANTKLRIRKLGSVKEPGSAGDLS
ncbi:hypothetical protein FCM35_KLT20486 [Carex littledalei]|uniref:Uncharacterized protein n=1 Tax=Carex littledalei TaxID=544730 RepID=A0A833R643_9POAL|nr:hypothetical protein FCM35_KLT20486 [Carex littledalei]